MSRATGVALDLLFVKDVVVDIQDYNGNTALHKAAGNISSLYVKKLLEHGADCNVINKICRQPLYYAICNGTENIISMLLNAGSDINQLDNNGDTMLHEFTKAKDRNKIIILLRSGADYMFKDAQGHTAHEIALSFEHEDIAQTIVLTVRSLQRTKRKRVG